MKVNELQSRLRSELAEYIKRPHRTQMYRDDSIKILRKLFLETKKYQDGWELLKVLDKQDGARITSAELKGALRDLLVKNQANRCCYCRRWLVNSAYARPIDHVLPRKHYKQFSLHFWNLVVACTDCNSLKGHDVWGAVNEKRRAYPRANSVTDWFHPRFHSYDEHVRFVRVESNGASVVAFRGVSPQGQALCKSLLRHIAAKEMLIKNNPVLSKCIEALNEHGGGLDEEKSKSLREFQDALTAATIRVFSGEEKK